MPRRYFHLAVQDGFTKCFMQPRAARVALPVMSAQIASDAPAPPMCSVLHDFLHISFAGRALSCLHPTTGLTEGRGPMALFLGTLTLVMP